MVYSDIVLLASKLNDKIISELVLIGAGGEEGGNVMQGHWRRKQNISGTTLRRRACMIVFGRVSPYTVHFNVALLERQEQHPATFFLIIICL